MSRKPPDQARQRFDGFGKPGEGFPADEPTVPQPSRCGCHPRVPSTLRSSPATEDGRGGSLSLGH